MRKLIEMPYEDSTVIVAVEVPDEVARGEMRKLGADRCYEDFLGTPQKVERDFGLVSDIALVDATNCEKSFGVV